MKARTRKMTLKPSHSTHSHIQTAIITGTSSGFGLLTAISMARSGYRVIATMRDLSKQGRLVKEAEEAGVWAQMECLELDVTDTAGINRTVADVIARFGTIDVLVNNAGFAVGGYTEEVSLEDWRIQMETNFFGVVSLSKAVLPYMREQGYGKIITVSSVSGRIALPGYGPYAASKFAIEGFSEALRLEMLPFGVHVVLVEPGSYRTDIWDKGFKTIKSPPDSPYRSSMEAMLSLARKSAANAPHPRAVASLIAKIAKRQNPRLRYPIGQGSTFAMLAKAVLPWKLFESIITRILKRKG
ncbi:SDR family oxidoreductase [Paenibacillus eucommiae]|uniref:NAD(P)-dependent dehydrogenase (Short-subunit alcohol dehydrogenase family) n=1 Tax=Paenibacillus eucommiae TaxID=1355755 RepID=A0ABS4ITA4_9BACL|nr:SDR family oxidoreductase [Paenibacillus eucommiae]MBP1990256.1 NAD(P)-dependent dehydrogenase (short-subunit alcohol dehydrogenase family) [Paenibacillus eucommiae]